MTVTVAPRTGPPWAFNTRPSIPLPEAAANASSDTKRIVNKRMSLILTVRRTADIFCTRENPKMKSYLMIGSLLTASVLIISASAIAHHGTGISYDLSKLVSAKGVIVKFAMSNPHSQLYFDVTDDKGNVEHWSAEMNAPTNLERAGFSRRQMLNLFSPGSEVTVYGFRSKSGAPVVVFSKAVLGDGREFKSQGGPGNIE